MLHFKNLRKVARPTYMWKRQKRNLSIPQKGNQENTNVHFRVSKKPHPLLALERLTPAGDHTGLQQNHVWSEEEINKKLGSLHHHSPVTVSDKIMRGIMRGLYHTFNFVTGYQPKNTKVKAVEWRLIVLESVAGVPGFVAAGFRHFKSLRLLQRDHGWIPTLLEEAENERMHLLTCLHMFNAGPFVRAAVLCAQCAFIPFMFTTYLIKPKAAHRFVGYLEETACETYKNVIEQVESPGTPLHKEWSSLPAPAIATGYWKLRDDAMWVDVLKCIFADEANHRDVNHTFSSMETDDPSPFVEKHREDAINAWRLEVEADNNAGRK